MTSYIFEERKIDTDQLMLLATQSHSSEASTVEGRYVIDQFYDNIPDPADVKQWYAGFTPEGYNEWARVVNFTEPRHITDMVCNCKQTGGLELPRSSVCLDIGSGTGIIGQTMQNSGFTNLHALDVSDNFLEAVRERGFYQEHHSFFMGKGVDEFPDNLKNHFDVVTASGVWMPGHMPKEALDDVHAALKVGGVLVTAMRLSMWTQGNKEEYREKIDGLVSQGKFEVMTSELFWRGTEGGTGLFAKQQSILLVLKKVQE